MGRRAKPPKGEARAKRPLARKSSKNDDASVGDPEKRLAEALGQLKTEAQEQQKATAEILRVISSSPTDVQPVFDAIVTSAVRLCGGLYGMVYRRDAEMIDCVAQHNMRADAREMLRRVFPRPVGVGMTPQFRRALLEGAVVVTADVDTDPELPARARAFFHNQDTRSVVLVPLLRRGQAIGVLGVGHGQTAAFSDDHVKLLQTFADQAVIAIENVRLFNETKEALEQQTATSEILRVISSSPTDIQPVLDALVESAARLCRSAECSIFLLDGDRLALRARYGPPPATPAEVVGEFALPIVRGTVGGRTVLERRTIHVVDLLGEADEFPQAQQNPHRTILSVPLIQEGAALGVIQLRRTEVNPFTDRQADLLKTFADQAVIAIENVRLFKELEARNRDLTAALEQQTATAEILRVISGSPTDIQPVLDAIAESAALLCEASDVLIRRVDGDTMRVVAHIGSVPVVEASIAQPISRGSVGGRSILERRTVHVHDVLEPQVRDEYPTGLWTLYSDVPYRTLLVVPLVREDTAIGTIAIRRPDVRPFSDKQVELLQTFADQAVIAIENVRLFTELQEKNRALTAAHAQVTEALDQQTATSDILRVISQSPTDVQPVFAAIVESARRLLNGFSAIVTRLVGDELHLSAFTRTTEAADALVKSAFPIPLAHGSLPAQVVRGGASCFVSDIETDERFDAGRREVARARGYRSIVHVPMLREGRAIGTIGVTRPEAGPFAPAEIALLQTFADQAVIAIENVRLFKELEVRNRDLTEALEQQTATAEILRVISSSPTDIQPVFDTIVRSAVRLLRGYSGGLSRLEGDQVSLVALTSTGAEADATLRAVFPAHLESPNFQALTIRARAAESRRDRHRSSRVGGPACDRARSRLSKRRRRAAASPR